MWKYPDIQGKNALVLAGSIDSIEMALRDGFNVYVFCASRRDGDVIAEQFAEHEPIVYNSFTKGDPRCDTVLKNQRLPENSRLFIGTSAAGVGISILDPKAKTIRAGYEETLDRLQNPHREVADRKMSDTDRYELLQHVFTNEYREDAQKQKEAVKLLKNQILNAIGLTQHPFLA